MGHHWTSKERTILCLLKRLCSRKYIEQVFNYLKTSNDNVGIKALDSQFHDMRNNGKGSNIFYRIYRCGNQELNSTFETYINDIRRAASTLGLDTQIFKVQTQPRTTRITNISSIKRRKRAASTPDTIATEFSQASTQPSGHEVRVDIQRFRYNGDQTRSTIQNTNQQPLPDFRECLDNFPITPQSRSTRDWQNRTIRLHPTLLFRATNSNVTFRARRFQDPTIPIGQPPRYKSFGWYYEVIPHLKEDHQHDSPFISLADNVSNAVIRVERSQSRFKNEQFSLAIFDFNAVQKDAEQRFGPDSGPYLVSDMFLKDEVSPLPGGYRGTGEWLCFGVIETEPITILDGGGVVTLAKRLRELNHGNSNVIPEVYRILSVVQPLWRETIACRFLRAYCGKTQYAQIRSRSYETFIRGIYSENIKTINSLNEISWIPVATMDNFSMLPTTTAQHTRTGLHQRLANIRSKQSEAFDRDRSSKSPLWSEDSEEDDCDLEAPGTPSRTAVLGDNLREIAIEFSTAPTSVERSEDENNSTDTDLDFVEDCLTQSLTREHLFAARKVYRMDDVQLSTRTEPRSGNIVQSIEISADNGLDVFSQELLANAFAPTPTPVSVATPNISQDIAESDDEDFVVIGSDQRERVYMSFRSLSMQDHEVIYVG